MKRNPFPWWQFWPEVEDNPRKAVIAIAALVAVIVICLWLS